MPVRTDIPQNDAYLALVQRIQALITSPQAQIEHQIRLHREPGESLLHWEQIAEQLMESEGVTVTRDSKNDTIHLSWYVEYEDGDKYKS
ncbi:DUF1654 domain-containing protein [Pseudomonas cichorii]|uniref:DUF1654 domain-containing protein n=1 Tax=Pseudomonas lijiangensis TaxID=2995658 RepID=A0ABX8HQ03_9PSED|nr:MULTISPECIES: DUF1654 domain-containing protein [Pseudomonas syringae group]MBX8502678.1 DUF1654 domain-containing protein [Pseudomonas lijiangensis]MBX8507626.1 DUF1654 domain-containing protein [Pseudomonas lijiangensis]MBX8512075.1 DUF1654 domain-containing protein [Pseudomonas cichorii]MBX8527055.1 DUF1654 domain-containing protein [Pseudomonas cichorii]MBX8552191.1 DUF1654 domain-containing protein [Pseudomonas cichorii]